MYMYMYMYVYECVCTCTLYMCVHAFMQRIHMNNIAYELTYRFCLYYCMYIYIYMYMYSTFRLQLDRSTSRYWRVLSRVQALCRQFDNFPVTYILWSA